jgi:hypothetical protein
LRSTGSISCGPRAQSLDRGVHVLSFACANDILGILGKLYARVFQPNERDDATFHEHLTM